VQIRNIATAGGNVANASPCGDTIPALMAPDAQVTVPDGGGRMSSRPIQEVVVGPGTTSLVPGEAIIDFTFAPLESHERSVFS
jgi:CO/xanthine dehydrogenase FAD-binding subunit